jgi:hypothetical protein
MGIIFREFWRNLEKIMHAKISKGSHYNYFAENCFGIFCQVKPEDNHRTEVERMRNKQRQRDQLFSADHSSTGGATTDGSWRKEQAKINAILDPKSNE